VDILLPALFGSIPTNTSFIRENLYYADSNLCDPNVNTHAGYPARPMDENGIMVPWPIPYILMADRGKYTLVTKARNAQRVGTSALIIADNSCLCTDADCIDDSETPTCETGLPILADDGSGSDITIPVFYILKPDADMIKSEVQSNRTVTMEITWY